jgi:phage shock protein E
VLGLKTEPKRKKPLLHLIKLLLCDICHITSELYALNLHKLFKSYKMKKLLFVVFATISLTSCSQKNNGYENVDVKQLSTIKSGDGVTILDVRTPQETAQGFVEGATFVNFYDNNFANEVEKLNKENPVYVYCKAGGRSAEASNVLVEKGFKKVYNVQGGFDSWKSNKLPISN